MRIKSTHALHTLAHRLAFLSTLLRSKLPPNRLFGCLAILPLLTGCITSNTLLAIQHPQPRHLPDFVDSWTSASLNQSNQLKIFVEGRMTNAPHQGKYTVTVPLSEAKIHPYCETRAGTNASLSWGNLKLPRSGIVEGWTQNAGPGATWAPVPIGLPITNTWELRLLTHAATLKPLPGTERTLYPLIDAKTNSATWPSPLEFIYIDSTHPEAFTRVEAETVQVPVNNDGYYALLPLTVAGDIATLPFQILLVIIWCSGGAGHC